MQNNELGRDVVSVEGQKKEKRCAEEVFYSKSDRQYRSVVYGPV